MCHTHMTHHHNKQQQQKPKDTSDEDWDLYNRRKQAELLLGARDGSTQTSVTELADLFKKHETEDEKVRRKMFHI
jgi:hypothetical protein